MINVATTAQQCGTIASMPARQRVELTKMLPTLELAVPTEHQQFFFFLNAEHLEKMAVLPFLYRAMMTKL